MAANLATFFESSKKVRGGKFVWVKDGNGEIRENVLLGGTLENPYDGFGIAHAADLVEYRVGNTCILLKSFEVKSGVSDGATTIVIKGDGYGCIPEVGMYLASPAASANTIVKVGKITAVVYSESNAQFTCTIDHEMDAIAAGTVLVEGMFLDAATADYVVDSSAATTPTVAAAAGLKVLALDSSKIFTSTGVNTFDSGTKATTDKYIFVVSNGKAYAAGATDASEVFVGTPMCKNPNTFIESDIEFIPTVSNYGLVNTNFALSTISGKKAFIPRMQPLPTYVLAKNKSNIDKYFSL